MKANISESDIATVEIGQLATLELKAFPNSIINGKVDKIESSGNISDTGKTTYGVEILLENSQTEQYKSGMTGDVEVNVGHLENVLRLPLNAIVLTSNGRGEVRVLNPEQKLITKEVLVGLVGNEYVEIIEGLLELEPPYKKTIGLVRPWRKEENRKKGS
ncbi:hypothetical protein AZF37_08065 [endosymbiont 'TC1' of Trimyema compressum]|nr:hypothetical protein AZF37_08065 [endosymbiont 'TC1' of Trimyema compressum]